MGFPANTTRISMTNANGTSTVYTYNKANLVTSVQNLSGNTLLSSHAYTYYLDGNIRTETADGETKSYEYDDLGRLTREVKDGVLRAYDISYTYDARGNRATKTQGLTTTTYSYDANNRLLAQSTGLSTTVYTYDANGNTLSAMTDGSPAYSYTYGLFGTQDRYTHDGILYTDYTYRPDGLRHSVGDTVHLWDGTNIVADVENGDATVYFRNINLIYAENDGEQTYYHFNAHGDVVLLTSENGIKEKSYEYSSFGTEYSPSISDDNPFRYCGEYCDTETNTIYLRARYYDSSLGRFTQEDPIRSSSNWYAYCNGNPIRYIDPSGKTVEDFIEGLVTSLDDNLTDGFCMYLVECLLGETYYETYEDEFDFYLGRVVGDILAGMASIGEFVSGLNAILTAIASGTITTVASGGTLSVVGVSICVAEVTAGAAIVVDGTVDLTRSVDSFSSDYDKLNGAYRESKMHTTSDYYKPDVHQYRKPSSSKSAKEAAKDVPSWAKGNAPYVGENGKQFAKRLMDERYGVGNYDQGVGSEYNKIKKWGDRGFEN